MSIRLGELCSFVTLIALILLKPQWTTENMSFKGSIFWNTGYSNFITIIEANRCLHLDPGGTLHFPKKILSLCHEKQNSHLALHQDHFHTNYQKHLRKIKSVEENKFNSDKTYQYFIHNKWSTFGHLDLQGMAYFFLEPLTLSSVKYIVLPNHGQPQTYKPLIINNLRKFKMRLAGSQSRSYVNHKSTETKFEQRRIPIIYKNIWGHIFLAEK